MGPMSQLKRGGLDDVVPAMQPRSWRLQTAMVFHSFARQNVDSRLFHCRQSTGFPLSPHDWSHLFIDAQAIEFKRKNVIPAERSGGGNPGCGPLALPWIAACAAMTGVLASS